MNKIKAIKILTEMNKWRQSEPPYDGHKDMPHTPNDLTAAIDYAVKALSGKVGQEAELNPLRKRLIRCITPNSKCCIPRDAAEDRAWDKVKKWVQVDHVRAVEVFYAAEKSENVDETWRRKHGTAALFNQLREQVDLAESFHEKKKPKFMVASEPKGWKEAAEKIASDSDCAQALRKELTLARKWSLLAPHVQSIILKELSK